MAIDKKNFITTFNSQEYFFKVTLYNGDKNTTPTELNYFFVDDLVIEETIFNWYTTGYITLRNEYEMLERGAKAPNTAMPDMPPLLTIRNDARNKVNIRIYPLLEEDSIESVAPELWELNFDFVIYNIEDLSGDDLSKKRKRLYLWDERYQHFLERNIQWSTYYVAAINSKKDDPLQDSSCKVGEAIKHLIQTACGENSINDATKTPLMVGWDPVNTGVGIDNPELSVASFNDKEWDDGTELNKITYTSPATYNVNDDIDYLMHYYVSDSSDPTHKAAGMPGLLRLNRYTKKWELTGIDKYYLTSTEDNKNPGKDSIERLEVQTVDDHDNTNLANTMSKTPDRLGSVSITSARDIMAGMDSSILSYRFVNMSSTDDLRIINRPVVNYNNNKCLWNVYFEDNTPEAVKESFKKDFLPKLYKGKDSGVLIGINKDKINGLSTMMQHEVVQSSAVNVFARNDMIYYNLFLNQALEFTSKGLTIRTPGKFIIIDRKNSQSEKNNDFEDKFVGQWLLSQVTHTFSKDTYLTNTISVKINTFRELAAFKPENDKFNE